MRILAFALAALLVQADDGRRDWGAALRADAIAMHDTIADSHPGPVNPADPGFAARNDAQLARAVRRAAATKNFADYFYAMQEYAASFDDGHLGYGVFGATPDEVRRWPGILTRYESDGEQRVFVSEPWSGVPLGASLVSCDGRGAVELGRERLGSRFGRWNLASQRQLFGAMTFLDVGDPYVAAIRRCRFRSGGKTLDVAMRWRPPTEDLYGRYVFPAPRKVDFDVRRLTDGTQWFSIPSFNSDPNSPAGRKLRELIAYIGTHAAEVRAAPAIVLDLRGNGGGSSDWSHRIAAGLWGEGALARHPAAPMTVSWRASLDNLAAVRDSFVRQSQGGHLSANATSWFRNTIEGLEKAVSAGGAMWVVKPERATADGRTAEPPTDRLGGPVYVVTDPVCMSACLDAVDLWIRLGAVTVGQETGADTLYMETRNVPLPSGLGSFSLPMKVYSGRTRGSNQPVPPRYRYTGDMTDTSALQNWVLTLPRRTSKRGSNVRTEIGHTQVPRVRLSASRQARAGFTTERL